MPLMTKDQGCFCCKPTVQSDICILEMTKQQFHGYNVITDSPSSFQETSHSSTAQNNSVSVSEPSWQQAVSLNINSSYPSRQLELNSLQGYNLPSQVIQEFEMFNIQNSHSMTDNKPSVATDFGEQSSSFNFRILQNRELGGKLARKPLLSLTKPTSSNSYSGCVSNDCDNTFATVVSADSVDSMDLDSALDELGMLSTVTNSRRQYLLETRDRASFVKCDQKLHSKRENSSNFSTLSNQKGYHIIQMNSNFVSSLNGASMLNQSSLCEESFMPESSRWKYRNPMEVKATRHQMSVPRMSRMKKDRYMYRRSRCPYKIPNRLCHTMPESSSGHEYFNTYANPFTTYPSLSDSGIDTPSGRSKNYQQLTESKSDTASPTKSHTDVSLVRSQSAEDLAPICRHLEKKVSKEYSVGCETEKNLDTVTSQMTYLHMS